MKFSLQKKKAPRDALSVILPNKNFLSKFYGRITIDNV